MFEYLQQVFGTLVAAIGTIVVAGGGLAAITYALFRFLGERWLTAKFDERLAAYKHAQQRELEHLRFEINALLDRAVKLHQKEFEVLPQAWSFFNDAYWQINGITGLKSYPDLNRLSDSKLEEFLKTSSLADWQKDELRSASDKLKLYIEYSGWKDISAAYKSYGDWQVYFFKNGIFMTDAIKKKFSDLDSLIKGALIEQEMRKTEKDLKLSEMKDYRRLISDGKALREELEVEVHKRLWDSTGMPAASSA
jgi:hypothetical protein